MNEGEGVPAKPKKQIKRLPKPTSVEAIKQSLRDALLKQVQHEYMRETQNNVEAIDSILEEFLSCFLLIGYNFEGIPITIGHAKNQKDSDALANALARYFAEHVAMG